MNTSLLPTRAKLLSLVALGTATVAFATPVTAATPGKPASCVVPNASAALLSSIPVDLPPLAAAALLKGSGAVRVDLDENGVARSAAIVTSSGWQILDAAALRAAMSQNYRPQIQDCANVAGSYRVTFEFA